MASFMCINFVYSSYNFENFHKARILPSCEHDFKVVVVIVITIKVRMGLLVRRGHLLQYYMTPPPPPPLPFIMCNLLYTATSSLIPIILNFAQRPAATMPCSSINSSLGYIFCHQVTFGMQQNHESLWPCVYIACTYSLGLYRWLCARLQYLRHVSTGCFN